MVNELIQNALDHAFPQLGEDDLPQPMVWVTLDREASSLRVEVVDNGIGVPEALDPAGGGLGLTIVSSLVTEELAGTIEIGPRQGEGAGLSGTRAQVEVEVADVAPGGKNDPTQELPILRLGG